MRELGVEINAVTMLSLIPACAGLGYFWLGTFMHCCCVKSGLVVDLSVANCLVTMYMKCGSVDYGRRLFNEIPEKGLFTWNAMISGYAQNGLASHVLELYREMKTCGVFPDAVTFVGVLSSVAHLGARSVGFSWTAIIGGYGMHGQGEVAVQLFDEMIRIGVRPDSTAFVCVLSACSHAGSGAPPRKFKGKKSKVAAKSGGQMYQWEIMRSVGISDSEISEFQAPEKWLKYFPPLAVEDLKAFGLGCDWRRSFVTTEINPFYDSFPCADHDRASGEGVQPQEYTLIKMEVLAPFPPKFAALEGRKVYLAAATLRPETMYGQTNAWVLPEGKYGAFEINENDVFIMMERAALNLADQNFSRIPKKPTWLS
ncbi:hypothetical protein LWI28_019539 [Acer negundo]|uniref:Uncharacterized protein n=1 Tax=Acer negundo TaxID=4023 RepID=A0AAD5I6V2_ACENE|nr:hypothetical protein LWI28_019539 [Acer negundo]